MKGDFGFRILVHFRHFSSFYAFIIGDSHLNGIDPVSIGAFSE
jgi:hypothetical protein